MYMGVRGLKSYSFDNTRSSISRAEGGPSNNGASGANMYSVAVYTVHCTGIMIRNSLTCT